MLCEDKVAVVTGAAGDGMGRSIALTLAREGAKVVVNYRASREMAEAVVARITERGGQALAAQADVSGAEGCRRLTDRAVEQFGRVDICVIGPGGGWHPGPPDRLDPVAALQDAHDELAPLYHLMPLVLPGMYKRRWGRVIALGLARPYESPAYSYNVGKAARASAVRLARDAAWARNVTVNVLAPGPVPPIETLHEAAEQCEHGRAWERRKTASPQDVAEGVAFLCSEGGRFISGCELPYMFR